MHERMHLKPGQKVFIPAGSGGIGTFAIQLAKHLGARVGTTTSTANVELLRGLGADDVVDYKKQPFEQVLRDYDAVLGTVRASAWQSGAAPTMPSTSCAPTAASWRRGARAARWWCSCACLEPPSNCFPLRDYV